MDRATDKGRERSFLAITVLYYGTVVLWCCLYLYMCMYVHALATVYKQLLIRLYSSGSEYVGCCSWYIDPSNSSGVVFLPAHCSHDSRLICMGQL